MAGRNRLPKPPALQIKTLIVYDSFIYCMEQLGEGGRGKGTCFETVVSKNSFLHRCSVGVIGGLSEIL